MIFPAEWQVPTFKETRLRPKQNAYCLCVFVINEGERIIRQLTKMKPLASVVDIVVADGGSTDGSLAEAGLRACDVTALLTKTGPGRLSAQMRMALAWAMANDYAGVVVIDGNDKDDTSAVPQFVELLKQGYDHVQGSRFITGGREENTPWSRLWGVKLIHAPLLSLAAHYGYTDTTNGFRAYSRRLLLDPRVQPFRDIFNNYELHYYLAIRAAQLGRVTETPVTRAYPKGEKTPSKIGGWRGNWNILKTLGSAVFHKWDPRS